jgi:hypothetical protein
MLRKRKYKKTGLSANAPNHEGVNIHTRNRKRKAISRMGDVPPRNLRHNAIHLPYQNLKKYTIITNN